MPRIKKPTPIQNPTSSNEEWDVVDEASFESFPASDPPGWGSHQATAYPVATVHPPEAPAVIHQPGVLARLARAFRQWVRRDADAQDKTT
jgi:hypothetical protein